MNSLNITQNSNDLNESEKTQEKLYSNEESLDDLLTYSDDLSQNQINNKPITNTNNYIKEKKENKDGDIELSNKKQMPIISSFNSEVGMSFLNNQNDNNNNININNNDYHSKSESKILSKEDIKENKNLIKSYSDSKSISFIKSNVLDFNINNNLKDISEIHISMSNLLSDFEIKDISISRSINENLKKNKSEKKNLNLNPVGNAENCLSLRSENLFYKKNKKNKNKEHISNLLNINNNQISEDHSYVSNANSMCNYQNISNINELSSKNTKIIIKKEENKQMDNKDAKLISKNEMNDLSIKLNISIDNYNDKKYKNEKKKYLDGIIDEYEINKKNNLTSNKKENDFYFSNQNNKILKNSLKYTKAQCVNALFHNNIFNNDNNNKNCIDNIQYFPSDNPIKTKDTSSDKNNQNIINKQNIVNLSPHKLFEIQKNDCIQISINNKDNTNTIINTKNNPSSNNDQSSFSINKVNDYSNENNYFYNSDLLKENNTTSFMIYPNQNSNNNKIEYYQQNKTSKHIYINNKNINTKKRDSNNFFYNPKNKIKNSNYYLKNNNNIKKSENDLQTPDLNKNKVAPMTCVHKGSLVYCNDNFHSNNNDSNVIKINKINDCSNLTKKNNYSFNNITKNSNKPKKSINNEKKLVYLKNIINQNNYYKSKQNTIKNKNKNNSFHNNYNDCLNVINKQQINNKRGKSNQKNDEKEINKKKEIYPSNNFIINKNNSKIKRNLNIRKSLNKNNSINCRRNVLNKIKASHKNSSLIDKINNDLIKGSSLFSILYNNLSQKNSSKNNSRTSSNDKNKEEKESTIIHNKAKNEKFKNFKKKVERNPQIKLKNLLNINIKSKDKDKDKDKDKEEKKIVKHNTNNSFSIYNSFIEKAFDESNKRVKLSKKKKEIKNKNNFNYNKLNDNNLNLNLNINKDKKNDNNNKIKNKNNISSENRKKENHKKINSQINFNTLNSNFNFINEKRRKNNKSLYNFGNIYFINQNHIIKNDFDTINSYNNNENINNNKNGHIINYINKIKNVEIKQNNKKQKNIYEMKENKSNNYKVNENININNQINPLNISNPKHNPKVIMDFSKYKKKDRNHFLSMADQENPLLKGYNIYNAPEYNETQLISEN